jgi:hypothetical protein
VVKPLVDLPDAERQLMTVLLDLGYASVSTDYPSTRLSSTAVHIQVDLESSNTDDFPVTERAQVRVVVHAGEGRRGAVKAKAAEVLADLYSFTGNADIAGIVPLSGRSAISSDPTTRNVMCWVLVRVDLLASNAS